MYLHLHNLVYLHLHIPHHSHNGRRSAPQCGLLAGDFHHRTSRISSLPTSRTYPAPFFSIFNPNITFPHHWSCLHTAATNPFILPCSLNVASCLPIESPPITIFFACQAFPTVPIASSNFPTHLVFFQARCTSLSSFSFQYSGAGLFDNPVCILECRIFRNYRTDLQKIEGKSRNHLFSHTQDWVGDTAV